MGSTLYRVGKMKQAESHLTRASRLIDAESRWSSAHLYGQDPVVSLPAAEAQVLWNLGYADRAWERMEVALKRSEERGHTASIAFALIFAAGLYQRANDPVMTAMYAERTIEYSRTHGFAQWVAVGTLYEGWAMFSLGHRKKGVALARQGFEATLKVDMIQLRYATLLAEVVGLAGEVSEGLGLVTDLLHRAHRLGELEWAAEMYRVKGRLLSLAGLGRSGRVFRAGHFTCAASSRAIPGIASGS